VRKMEVTSEMPGHCAWFKTHNKHNRQFRCWGRKCKGCWRMVMWRKRQDIIHYLLPSA
jgi:hypothetical protein